MIEETEEIAEEVEVLIEETEELLEILEKIIILKTKIEDQVIIMAKVMKTHLTIVAEKKVAISQILISCLIR